MQPGIPPMENFGLCLVPFWCEWNLVNLIFRAPWDWWAEAAIWITLADVLGIHSEHGPNCPSDHSLFQWATSLLYFALMELLERSSKMAPGTVHYSNPTWIWLHASSRKDHRWTHRYFCQWFPLRTHTYCRPFRVSTSPPGQTDYFECGRAQEIIQSIQDFLQQDFVKKTKTDCRPPAEQWGLQRTSNKTYKHTAGREKTRRCLNCKRKTFNKS